MAKPMLAYQPYMQFFDTDGSTPLSGGKVFIYQAGTSTKLTTYPTAADAIAGTNANTNPIILDSSGKPEVSIYVTQSYKMIVASSTDTDPPTGTPIATIDNVVTLGQLESTLAKTTNYTVVADDRDKTIKVDASGGAVTITLPAVATCGDGFRVTIKKTDTSTNAVTIQANAAELIDGYNTLVIFKAYGSYSLLSDGTQWLQNKSIRGEIEYIETTVTAANLASAASKIIRDSSGSQQYKIREIMLSGSGTNFSGGGGNRLMSITDGTSIWTVVPAATMQSLTTSRWGLSTPVPFPATSSHFLTASAAGTDIVAKYSGGTTDYSTGSLTIVVAVERVA